jgi:signal peptidase I
MQLLEKINSGKIQGFEWFYFLALALILAFGTIQTTGTSLSTERPVVSVISCSMYPEYDVGDILVVDGQEFEDIEVGDVAIYNVPDRVDFSVDGTNYTLEENSPHHETSVSTSIGEIRLLEVQPNLRNGNDKVLISVDDKRVAGSERLGFDSTEIKLQRISGHPYPIVHRVVEKGSDSMETRGDANNEQLDFESDVRPFQIYGTTAFKIPRVGVIKLLIMDLVGFQGDKPFVIDNMNTCP